MEINYFVQRAGFLEKEIDVLERKIKKYPKGKLSCVHNGKYKKWYVRCNGEGLYITKKRKKYLHKMAEKTYMTALLEDDKLELNLLKGILYSNGIIQSTKDVISDAIVVERKNGKICRTIEQKHNDANIFFMYIISSKI